MVDGYGLSDGYAIVSADYPVNGDFGTIQDAINAGCRSIYVLEGIYTLAASITIPAGVTILGENAEAVIINSAGLAHNVILNGIGIIVENVTVIDCQNGLGAFEYNSADNCYVRNCNVEFSTRAAFFNATTFSNFENCQVQGMSLQSIFVDVDSSDNRIMNNNVRNGGSYGIALEGSHNKVLHNTVVAHVNNDGIFVTSPFNTIMDNTVNNNANGIYVASEGGDFNTIMGNTCNENQGYGININNAANTTGNTLIGNVCQINGVADLRFVPNNIAIGNSADTVV